MRKKLTIICTTQFGYHVDTLEYCKVLNDIYNITYICWDYNDKKVNVDNINIKYISRNGNKFLRNFRFIQYAIKYLSSIEDKVFIKYFVGASFIRIFKPKQKLILDIRTGAVSKNWLRRICFNSCMKIESLLFKNVSIISESLAHKFHIKNAFILPLGANKLSSENNVFNSNKINLIYIGTFDGRNVDHTVKGIRLFLEKNKNNVPVQYLIIGSGSKEETNKIKNAIRVNRLEKNVKLLGFVPHNQLFKYLSISNIGVSYIPKTSYYNLQPPTKTFEYILAGLPVIGTSTYEHCKIINESNGVLVDDNALSFSDGLSKIYDNLNGYDSEHIMSSIQNYTWQNIIAEKLHPFIESI